MTILDGWSKFSEMGRGGGGDWGGMGGGGGRAWQQSWTNDTRDPPSLHKETSPALTNCLGMISFIGKHRLHLPSV